MIYQVARTGSIRYPNGVVWAREGEFIEVDDQNAFLLEMLSGQRAHLEAVTDEIDVDSARSGGRLIAMDAIWAHEAGRAQRAVDRANREAMPSVEKSESEPSLVEQIAAPEVLSSQEAPKAPATEPAAPAAEGATEG